MAYTDILKVIPTVQSAALVNHNLANFLRKRKKRKGMVGMAVDNIVGTALIKETAGFTGGF